MTLNGNSTIQVALGGTYTELGATAYDTCAGNSLTVTTTGTVNTSVVGEYDITYSAVTGDGVLGSLTRMVMVVDPALNNSSHHADVRHTSMRQQRDIHGIGFRRTAADHLSMV